MIQNQFQQYLNARLERIQETLGKKAKEYVRGNNSLHNFERGAEITGKKSSTVLDVFMLKHYISYRDMIDDIENGFLPTEELVIEKFGDLINYFILQEALILEQIDKENGVIV